MSRLLAFVLALTVAHVVVSIALVPSTICQERCADDGPEGRCPPVCPTCVPTGHAASPVYVAGWSAPTVRHEALLWGEARVPGDPEPHDIFHVPRPLLA